MSEVQRQDEAQDRKDQVDPWEAAFAALGQEMQDGAVAAADAGDSTGGELPAADGADEVEDADATGTADGAGDQGDAGEPGDTLGHGGTGDDEGDWFDLDITQEEVDEYRQRVTKDIEDRTIRDVAAAYIKQGARNTNGVLGANVNDPDICKRGADGIPHFYNPETGREFTGPNPRKEAQEWVDSYNQELRDAFNKTCGEYSAKLMANEESKIAIIEFAPTYKALDPIRRSMLDAMIEDYEITDKNGDVIGYTCNLNTALAAVNRQVKMIQSRYTGGAGAKPAPTGPVLDTPSTSPQQGGDPKPPEFKSIAEAMEWQQDQLLAKMRNGGRR